MTIKGRIAFHKESDAIASILDRISDGEWEAVSSSIAIDEINAMPNLDRRTRVRKLLPARSAIMELRDAEYNGPRNCKALVSSPLTGFMWPQPKRRTLMFC